MAENEIPLKTPKREGADAPRLDTGVSAHGTASLGRFSPAITEEMLALQTWFNRLYSMIIDNAVSRFP